VIGNVNEISTLDALYRGEYAGMVRSAYSLTSDDQIAMDVVQDAFVRLHQAGDRVRNSVAYLRTTVVNGCRSHHRHHAVVRRVHRQHIVAGRHRGTRRRGAG